MHVLPDDWGALFRVDVALAEIFVRGTLVYLGLFAYFRILRREAGGLGISDVLVVVLLADAAQNAMSGGYASVTEGAMLVATIAFWDYLIDFAAYRFPALRRIALPKPLLLVRNGKVMDRNLRREMITHEELRALLREHGVSGPHEVRTAFLECDGRVSVVKRPELAKDD